MLRETWLNALLDELRKDFQTLNFTLPEKIRVSCGFPSKSALAQKARRIGEAWTDGASGDQHFEVFISPLLSDPATVAATLVHEACHCAVGVEHKHKGPFREVAKAIGLEGKMTSTTAGEKLKERLHDLTEGIGPYPHAELKHSSGPPKQGTRMLKIECPACGYAVRTTKKWLEVGLPTCPCGETMESV